MTTPGRNQKKQRQTSQIDLEAKGQTHNQIKILIEDQALAWGQVEIPCSEIHKVVSSWA